MKSIEKFFFSSCGCIVYRHIDLTYILFLWNSDQENKRRTFAEDSSHGHNQVFDHWRHDHQSKLVQLNGVQTKQLIAELRV